MNIVKMLKINLIVASIAVSPFILLSVIQMFHEHSVNAEQVYNIIHLILAIFLVVNIICIPIYIVIIFLKTKNIINTQYIDLKESIYTRELPEEYNSVIAGELLDLSSNIKDEYLAGVIELISKDYIIENGERLIINNEKSTDKLLKNEKYILKTCTNFSEVTNEFFMKIKEDMLDLGLYKKSSFLRKSISSLKKIEHNKVSETVIGLLVFMIFMAIGFIAIFNFKLMFWIVAILYIATIIIVRKNKLTKKGELEKEKISKLKLFFDKETTFRDKTKEERKIWGRYSAFAVALGANEKLKEEIYEKVLNGYNIKV